MQITTIFSPYIRERYQIARDQIAEALLNLSILYVLRPIVIIVIAIPFIISQDYFIASEVNIIPFIILIYFVFSLFLGVDYFNQTRRLGSYTPRFPELSLEVLFISILFWLTRNVESDFYLLYLFPLFIAADRLPSLNQVVLFYLTITSAYIAVVMLMQADMSLPDRLVRSVMPRWTSFTLLFLLTAIRSYTINKRRHMLENFEKTYRYLQQNVISISMLDEVTQTYIDLFNAIGCHLRLERQSDDNENILEMVAISGVDYRFAVDEPIYLNQADLPLFVQKYKKGEIHIANNAHRDSFFDAIRKRYHAIDDSYTRLSLIHSFVCIPMRVGKDRFGLITLSFRWSNYITSARLRRYQEYTNYISAFLHNLEVSAIANQYVTLYDRGLRVAGEKNKESQLQRIVESVVGLFDAQAGSVYIAEPKKQHLRIVASIGMEDLGLRKGQILPYGKGIIGKLIAENRQTIICNDYPAEKEALDEFKQVIKNVIVTKLLHPETGMVLGILEVANKWHSKPNQKSGVITSRFSVEYDQPLLERFAQAACNALYLSEILELEQKVRKSSQLISGNQSENETIQGILNALSAVVDFDTATIMEIDGNCLRITGYSGFDENDNTLKRVFDTDDMNIPNYEVIKKARIIRIADLLDSKYASISHDSELLPSIRAWLGVPLRVSNTVIGMLTLDRRVDKWTFTDLEQEYAQVFADHVALALRNSNLMKHERVLREMANTLGKAYDAEQLGLVILHYLRKLVLYDTASIQSIQNGAVRRVIVACDGLGQPLVTDDPDGALHSRIDQDKEVLRIYRTKEILVIPNTETVWDKKSQLRLPNVKSWIGVPLLSEGNVIGIITLDYSRPGYYSLKQFEHRLSLFAAQAAIAVSNADLKDKAEKRRERMKDAQSLAIIGLLFGENTHHSLNKLVSILSNAQYLEDYDIDRNKVREVAHRIVNTTNYVLDVIEDIGASINPPRPVELNLKEIIQQTFTDTVRNKSEIKLDYQNTTEVKTIIYFDEQFRRILRVLFVDSEKALNREGKGGNISVSVKNLITYSNLVVINVFTPGQPLSDKKREKLFQMRIRRMGKGFGLGLAWAQLFLRWHDGDLDSPETQNGVTMRIKIPVDVSVVKDAFDE